MSLLNRISYWFGAKPSMTHIVAGNLAPNFFLKSLDCKDFALTAAIQKGPTLLAFFKIDCPTCQFTFPFLERIYQRFTSPNFTLVGISQNGPEKTASFKKEYGITFPLLLDPEEKGYAVSNAYGLTYVPTLILIDTDVSVLVSSTGFVRADLEAITARLTARNKLENISLFLPTESIPANKPG